MRIRLRTDRVFHAQINAWRAAGKALHQCSCRQRDCPWCDRKTPPAEPGDVWFTTWAGSDACAGYAICCPTCKDVHFWTSAYNCSSRRKTAEGYDVCDHTGVGSCWTWTGAAEAGTLSASPSLFADPAHGGCGFHGFLRNGDLA